VAGFHSAIGEALEQEDVLLWHAVSTHSNTNGIKRTDFIISIFMEFNGAKLLQKMHTTKKFIKKLLTSLIPTPTKQKNVPNRAFFLHILNKISTFASSYKKI
jgi:hypothetical protein